MPVPANLPFPMTAHPLLCSSFFFFNDTATTEIYTLSLHDALPICWGSVAAQRYFHSAHLVSALVVQTDRKSTRLNSSHQIISYAVFCLKKKKSSLHPYPHTSTRKPFPVRAD